MLRGSCQSRAGYAGREVSAIEYDAALPRQLAIARTAGQREAGACCPYCGVDIAQGESVLVCGSCGKVHHEACWLDHDRCGSYDCAPPRRSSRDHEAEAKLLISFDELRSAVPLPPRRTVFAPPGVEVAEPRRPRFNRLAIAAMITAIAGIPFFGILTGLVALLLGAFAIGSIRGTPQKGMGLAVSGLLLGLADVIGWACVLFFFMQVPEPEVDFDDVPADVALEKDIAPKIRQAMYANVLIERRSGWKVLGNLAIGSGVILDVGKAEALIVTNRHVVDTDFPHRTAAPDLNELNKRSLRVKLLGQPTRAGRVVWVAPDGVDLALVRVPAPPKGTRAARWEPNHSAHVGDPVFAIGNPHRLSWTHTQGVISQFRTRDLGSRRIRVIQTQAAINPGNSGGGLYDEDGYLLGINTWTNDKRISEGLSFAIALDSLLELSPPGLEATALRGGQAPERANAVPDPDAEAP